MLTEVRQDTKGGIKGELFCLQTMFTKEHDRDQRNPLIMAYKATSDPNSMYYHEAMCKYNSDKFRKAMEKGTSDHFESGNFSIILMSKVPNGQIILPAVWKMRCKQDIKTG